MYASQLSICILDSRKIHATLSLVSSTEEIVSFLQYRNIIPLILSTERGERGTDEMAQWLSVLAALAEDAFSFQHSHGSSSPYITPISRSLMPPMASMPL